MSRVEPKYVDSLEFLKGLRAAGPWVVTAIRADRKGIVTATYDDSNGGSLLKWLDEHGDGSNVYYTLNPVRKPVDKKPSRADIEEMSWLHVDVDPRAGENPDEERERILAMLKEPPGDVPPPTLIVDSGGGFQAFWRLRKPFPIKGKRDAFEEAKRWNQQLELVFGADHCHNVDRIMRLPSTVNRPDEKKRKKGRVERLASVVLWEKGRIYGLEQFQQAPKVASADGDKFESTIEIGGNVRRLASLDELPDGVPLLCKIVIAQGFDAGDEALVSTIEEHKPDVREKWESRSEALFYVCCELKRQGVDDETVYAIITDPDWGISDSVLNDSRGVGRGDVDRYALRQIERASEEVEEDPWLRQLNDKFAVVQVGGKTRVIFEENHPVGDQVRTRVQYQTFDDFCRFHQNKFVSWLDPKGNQVKVSVGKWWLHHPRRREFETVVFAPGREVPGAYNLWRGFAYEAKPGECSKYLAHVRDNICQGNDEHYEYLVRWMALAVQRPAQPGQIAVVLRGRMGTGKGVFTHAFGALFGRHYLPVRDSQHIFGQFNSHLKDCVVLFADEAFWAGDKKRESMLKAIVTEDVMVSERKGYDAEATPNFLHLIMSSNEDWVVPAGADDRRFFVLDVGDGSMQDGSYFAAIHEELADGGHEALLYYLRTLDLEGFDVRKVPKTAALRDQKVHSFAPEVEWWYTKLQGGRIFEDSNDWERQVFSTRLAYDFTTHSRAWGARGHASATKLGKAMARFVPRGWTLRGQIRGEHPVIGIDGNVHKVSRPHVYLLPALGACRRHFDENFGGPFEWADPVEVDSDKSPDDAEIY